MVILEHHDRREVERRNGGPQRFIGVDTLRHGPVFDGILQLCDALAERIQTARLYIRRECDDRLMHNHLPVKSIQSK